MVEVISRGSDGRVRYPESYAEYGRRFGKSPRTIRSWVSHGESLDPPVLPPLHDPDQLVEWFRAHRNHKVPAGIIEASELDDPSAPRMPGLGKKNSSDSDSENAPPSSDPQESILLEISDDIDADAGLQQARTLAQLAWEEMQKAYEQGNRTKAREWKKDWREAVTTQRAWEKDINKIMEDRGALLRKAKLVAELISMAASISRNVLNGLVEVVDHILLVLPAEEIERLRNDRKARRAVALQFRDQIFAKLRATQFADSFREGVEQAKE